MLIIVAGYLVSSTEKSSAKSLPHEVLWVHSGIHNDNKGVLSPLLRIEKM